MKRWRRRFSISLGHMFEYYDLAIYSVIAVYIAQSFFPESVFGTNSAWLVWMTFGCRLLSRPVGGVLIGFYADRCGRKSALILTSVITGVATLLMACMPTYYDIGITATILFFIMQLAQAFSFGGENPTSIAYLMEDAKANEEARIGAVLWGSSLISVILSLLVVGCLKVLLTEAQMYDFGWRIPLLLGIINILMSFYFKLKLLESSEFKQSEGFGIQLKSVLKVALMVVPTSVIVYTNTFSSAMLAKQFSSDPSIQANLPIVLNACFYVACWLVAWFIDRHSSCQQTLNKTYAVMFIFAIPIYALQESGGIGALLISQALITLFVAVTLTATPAVIFDQVQADSKHRITSLALGLNLSVSTFGAFSPVVVHSLIPLGHTYLGCMMSGCAIFYFIGIWLDRYWQQPVLKPA
jgi:MHS family proline/betaine transporter-like MFS transporter